MSDLEHKILYQLVARGCLSCFNQKGKIHSKKVFCDKTLAENYKDEFRKIVTTPISDGDLFYLEDDKHLEIDVIDLFLIG